MIQQAYSLIKDSCTNNTWHNMQKQIIYYLVSEMLQLMYHDAF